jgi:hypothetical protein
VIAAIRDERGAACRGGMLRNSIGTQDDAGGVPVTSLEDDIRTTAQRLREGLARAVSGRHAELQADDTSHYEVYRILGVPPAECGPIDLYQNVGRFVYKYAGSLLEETTKLVLSRAGEGGPLYLPNTVSPDPRKFEIDCYTKRDNKAHEIKWRDATTDGDHIKKETNKVKTIVAAGHTPVRVMFYMPVRTQARAIQNRILGLFREYGEAYVGDEAWSYVSDYSSVDLRGLLREYDFPHPDWINLADELEAEGE